uniref:Uncharacterized protein n=1 Tax=Panagrolaimus davidi TaxID=227884 RepID=A0A914P7Y1_9BILA
MIERIPNYSSTTCTYFACFLNLFPPLYVMTSKIASSGINIAACVVLMLLLKIYIKTENTSGKRISKTVVVIILITTLVDFGPTLIGKLIWMTVGVDIAIYIGPYMLTFSFLNTTLCAAIYSRAFRKSATTTSTQIITLFKSTHSKNYKITQTSKNNNNFTNVSTF